MSSELDIHNYKDRKSVYDDVVAPRMGRRSGFIAHNGVVVCETLQCNHCQKHFPVRRGSETVRGFCMGCMKVTCGKPECVPCIPWEKKMSLIEAACNRRRIVDSYLSG